MRSCSQNNVIIYYPNHIAIYGFTNYFKNKVKKSLVDPDLVLNHFHASDYIFIMTPWESLLESNNGSSIIKQLALIAFFTLEYIYILSYHPWNPNSFNMDQILHTTQLEKDLLKIEKKITKYIYHKEFLENYKYNRKYPKGLALTFNLA